VLQCVAVCCRVMHCVTMFRCQKSRYVAVYCSVLQCIAVCCRVLQCVLQYIHVENKSVLQSAAVWCNVLQCVATYCNVLQWVVVHEYWKWKLDDGTSPDVLGVIFYVGIARCFSFVYVVLEWISSSFLLSTCNPAVYSPLSIEEPLIWPQKTQI